MRGFCTFWLNKHLPEWDLQLLTDRNNLLLKIYYWWWSETFEWDLKVTNGEFVFNKSKIEESVKSELHVVVLVSSTWGLDLGFKYIVIFHSIIVNLFAFRIARLNLPQVFTLNGWFHWFFWVIILLFEIFTWCVKH